MKPTFEKYASFSLLLLHFFIKSIQFRLFYIIKFLFKHEEPKSTSKNDRPSSVRVNQDDFYASLSKPTTSAVSTNGSSQSCNGDDPRVSRPSVSNNAPRATVNDHDDTYDDEEGVSNARGSKRAESSRKNQPQAKKKRKNVLDEDDDDDDDVNDRNYQAPAYVMNGTKKVRENQVQQQVRFSDTNDAQPSPNPSTSSNSHVNLFILYFWEKFVNFLCFISNFLGSILQRSSSIGRGSNQQERRGCGKKRARSFYNKQYFF
jgi:hypothetical protein